MRFVAGLFWGAVGLIVALVVARFLIIIFKNLGPLAPVGQVAEHYSGLAA